MVNATHHQRGAGCSTTPEMRSVSQLKLRRFKTSGALAICRSPSLISGAAGTASMIKSPIANCQLPIATIENRKSKIENSSFRYLLRQACGSDVLGVRHLWIRIADAREIAGSGDDVQVIKQAIIAILFFHFRYATLHVLDIAETDCACGAGLRACCSKRIARNVRVRRRTCTRVRRNFCFLDTLDAECAFFHHAAHAHGNVRIFLHLDNVRRTLAGKRREIFLVDAKCAGDFLLADRPLVVIEIIEPAYLERTVVGAIARADAAIVSHDIQAVLAVDRCVYRANGLARRVLAMLARHRLMHDLRMLWPIAIVLVEGFPAGVIAIDAEPVHDAAMGHLQFAYDRNVVLALARDHTSAASRTNIEIDAHSPLLRRVERRMRV